MLHVMQRSVQEEKNIRGHLDYQSPMGTLHDVLDDDDDDAQFGPSFGLVFRTDVTGAEPEQ